MENRVTRRGFVDKAIALIGLGTVCPRLFASDKSYKKTALAKFANKVDELVAEISKVSGRPFVGSIGHATWAGSSGGKYVVDGIWIGIYDGAHNRSTPPQHDTDMSYNSYCIGIKESTIECDVTSTKLLRRNERQPHMDLFKGPISEKSWQEIRSNILAVVSGEIEFG